MTDRDFHAADRHGNVTEFKLKTPTLSEENEGERQYRIAYSKALVEGVFPKEKLRELMREHGMWTDGDDKELKKAVGKIALLQIDLKNAEHSGDDKTCLELAKQISEQRKRMWELFLVQQSVYMNSAEGVAEMIKTEAIMAACTILKSTNKRYWENYQEYVRERDENDKSTVYSNIVELQSKILDEARLGLIGEYPEQQYLKTVEDRMIDRELQEEVTKELRSRAEAAIEKDNQKKVVKKKASKKKSSRRKTSGKSVANVSRKTSPKG